MPLPAPRDSSYCRIPSPTQIGWKEILVSGFQATYRFKQVRLHYYLTFKLSQAVRFPPSVLSHKQKPGYNPQVENTLPLCNNMWEMF